MKYHADHSGAGGLLHSTYYPVHGRLMLQCGFLPRSLAAEIASCSDGADHVSRTLSILGGEEMCILGLARSSVYGGAAAAAADDNGKTRCELSW